MKLTSSGIALRFLFAALLVFFTYNPSGFSYAHWLYKNLATLTPYIAIAGLALLIGWVIYLKATFNSLGLFGILLASALFGCFIWLLIYWKIISINNTSGLAWAIELVLAVLLTLGMCWSYISRRLSGQIDIDEINED